MFIFNFVLHLPSAQAYDEYNKILSEKDWLMANNKYPKVDQT